MGDVFDCTPLEIMIQEKLLQCATLDPQAEPPKPRLIGCLVRSSPHARCTDVCWEVDVHDALNAWRENTQHST